MLRGALLFAIMLLTWPVGSAWAEPGASGDPQAEEPASAPYQVDLADWLPRLDPAGLAIARYLQTRELNVMEPVSAAIPFDYPDRPTVTCWVGGEYLPLLFNTGTNTCILWEDETWPDWPYLDLTAFSPVIASLEGKPLTDDAGQRLEYARAFFLDAGPLTIFDVPFRVYHGGASPTRDFAGALAPVALRRYVIEVDNSAQEIRLHQRQEWCPPGTVMLPLLSLPRGIFIPLWLGAGEGGADAELLWFHLDTGFSGTLGVVPAVRQAHPAWFAASPLPAQDFTGWHAQYSYEPLVIARVELRPYPLPGLAGAEPLAFTAVEGLAYRDAYAELPGYNVGGIVGSGFLMRFHYALDYELARFYILP